MWIKLKKIYRVAFYLVQNWYYQDKPLHKAAFKGNHKKSWTLFPRKAITGAKSIN